MLFGTKRNKPMGLFDGFAPSAGGQMPSDGQAMPPVQQTQQAQPSMEMQGQPAMPGAAPKRKVNWGGVLADFVAGLAGQQGPYLASLNARRDVDERRQQAEAERMAKREDWQWQEQYKRDNPAPSNNDTVSDYNFISQNLGAEAANQYLRNMGDPIVTVPLPNGQIYTGPRSQMGAVMTGQQGGDSEWGDPVDVIPGGGRSNAPGGFPRR